MGAAVTAPTALAWYVAYAEADAFALERMELVTMRQRADDEVVTEVDTLVAAPDGAETLCAVAPIARAPDEILAAYVRVFEQPTPRWTTFVCLRNPDYCDDSLATGMIQERAWSSPIWTYPAP